MAQRIPRRTPVLIRGCLVVRLLLVTALAGRCPIALFSRAIRRHRLRARVGQPVMRQRIPRRTPVLIRSSFVERLPLLVTALAWRSAVLLADGTGRRVQRNLAVVGDPVIARARHQRAVAAGPRRLLVLGLLGRGLGLALALVQHLGVLAERRHGALTRMGRSLLSPCDHHLVARLRADPHDLGGLHGGRLA